MVGCVCVCCFFFDDTATTEIYTLSLHDALPISLQVFRQSHLKPQDFELQVGRFQQRAAFSLVLGLNQQLQQIVQTPFQAFAQHKAVLSRKTAGVITIPQDEIVGQIGRASCRERV